MKIAWKKLTSSAKMPERGSAWAAGYDLFADIAEETRVALAVPEGYFGGVFARSGLSAKEGLRPANCTGVVDADYRGEVKVALHNDSGEERVVAPGQKIAQLVIMPFLSVEFEEVADLDETERGQGGFGSTGKM